MLIFKKEVAFDFLTQQFVECVSCSGAVGLWGHQRAKGDFSKPLQAADPAGKDKQCIFGIKLPIHFILINNSSRYELV